MEMTITAVYEKGVLKPLTSLDMPERTRVKLRIVQQEGILEPSRQQVHDVLVAAGLSLPRAKVSSVSHPISNEQRERLATLFATGGPLSDLVIAEREAR